MLFTVIQYSMLIVSNCLIAVDTFVDVLLPSFCEQQQDRQQLMQLKPDPLEHQ